ncbi:hypothetical protein ACSFA0_22640 [Variovorax sp. LT1P1]|uniref:hypothetical protein n=1 Tax=Variovorax sp. LT1P1 TaxID=3443730 RepID=UPI003F460381
MDDHQDLPPPQLLRTLHADRPPEAPYLVYGYTAEQLCQVRAEAAEDALPLQTRVEPWLLACFGPVKVGDEEVRNQRFLEESLELVQSCGCTASVAHQLVDWVYSRPSGHKAQEVGGVMTTLAALALVQRIDMHAAADAELARIWTMVDAIRAKDVVKPRFAPREHSAVALSEASVQQGGGDRQRVTEPRAEVDNTALAPRS